MAKRRSSSKTGGDHKAPRVPYQIPEPFSKLARRVAATRQQPTLWYILHLILEDAKKAGVPEDELPKPPWTEAEGG